MQDKMTKKHVFHQLHVNPAGQEKYFIIALGLEESHRILSVMDYEPSRIRSYIVQRVKSYGLASLPATALQSIDSRLVVVYNRVDDGGYNEVASQLTGQAVHGYVFICLETDADGEYMALNEEETNAVVKAIEALDLGEDVEFKIRDAEWRITFGSKEMHQAFAYTLKRVFGVTALEDVTMRLEYRHFDMESTRDAYYRSQSGQFFIYACDDETSWKIKVRYFKRVEELNLALDEETINALVMLEQSGAKTVEYKGAPRNASDMVKQIVTQYLHERGYEFGDVQAHSYTNAGGQYRVFTFLGDETCVHIDYKRLEDVVQLQVYEEGARRDYGSR